MGELLYYWLNWSNWLTSEEVRVLELIVTYCWSLVRATSNVQLQNVRREMKKKKFLRQYLIILTTFYSSPQTKAHHVWGRSLTCVAIFGTVCQQHCTWSIRPFPCQSSLWQQDSPVGAMARLSLRHSYIHLHSLIPIPLFSGLGMGL